MNDLAETEREVGEDVLRRDEFQDRQLGDGGQRMRYQRQRPRSRPGPFDGNVLARVRRGDVETAIGTRISHPYGYFDASHGWS